MRIFKIIAAIVCIVIGGLWALQGAGYAGGSFMTGQTQWLWIGLIVFVFGLGLLVQTLRARRWR